MASSSQRAKNPFLALLGRVASELEPKLSRVLEESEAQAHGYAPEVGQMVGAVRSLCERGGKRLRPGLCMVGALCVDPAFDEAPVIQCGVALELLQAYFLIHDDWMDQDDERRGGPTAHRELSSRFRSRKLGERSAILAGDHAVALATRELARVSASSARLRNCFLRFAEMQLSAVAGQQLDICGKAPDPELTYLLKTASYTVRGPLLLGAELAAGKRQTLQALDSLSLPLGIAFQLRDDLLGVFGSPAATGKPQGGDLREGKNTTLVREALRRFSPAEKSELKRVLGNRKASAAQVTALLSRLEASGAKEAVEARISALKSEAERAIDNKFLSPLGQKLLRGSISALSDRTA